MSSRPAAGPDDHPSAHRRCVTGLLADTAREHPGRPAASFPEGQESYAELRSMTLLAARRLHAAGVSPGDRVGILLRRGSPAYLAHALGAMTLGAICVGVNARNKVRELGYVLRHSGMRLLLSDEEFAGLIAQTGLPDGCAAVSLGADAAFDAGAARVTEDDVLALEDRVTRGTHALLLYTSGTTADPKGCLHSHATLLAEGENCCERLAMTAADRFWTPLPLFHIGGWQVLMTTLSRGACFSHAGLFEPTAALDQLERERVTVAFPAFELIWNDVLSHPRFAEADLGALRAIMNVGAPARLEQMQAQVPHAAQISCFGSTESCGSICLGDPLRDSLHSRTHTSGRPMTGVEVRIVDPDSGAECGPGVPGEMWFRSPTRFVGYYGDPAATGAAVDAGGWFATGDLMAWQDDGTLTFMGRLKDMLKVGGENVSAADIEGYLITHPAIAVAAVVGVPDDRYGEVPAAFVQLAPGAELTEAELVAFCTGRIATYKIPRYLRVLEEFPVTPTQKIQKYVLRDRMRDELAELGITEAPRIAGA
ncbi:acyl--CoA ligase [Baekduia soli]|uniref:Acyl--CoA ligase n=1 Tax=Baekduia soli TaxID=496014 RepID=A0A5B8UBU3_9ACTN|nr:class I adenylate-forming enzyme family protein [Baekduia soli]QEC50525.1 acyl--CoA ligase [Baekduia soli]